MLVEPRLGLAYDLAGDGKTALRASFGIFHNTRVSGNVNWQASRNPPLQLNPQIFYGTMATLLQSTGVTFPSTRQGFDREHQHADALQLHRRRPARHRLEDGRRCGLRRIADAAPAADAQPEHGPLRRAVRSRQPGSDASGQSAAGQLLPARTRATATSTSS